MLAISQTQIDNIEQSRRASLIFKLDGWLAGELPFWPSHPQDQRHSLLSEAVSIGEDADLHTEMDFALLARLLAELGAARQNFLAHPRVVEVLNWKVRNAGAKLRELYRLAEGGVESGHV